MQSTALPIAYGLFILLTVGVLVLPARWAVFSFLLLAMVDASGISQTSSFLGEATNGVKALLLPVALFLRLSPRREPFRNWSFTSKLWMVFAGYVAFAILWTPYPLPGLKMAAYVGSYVLLYPVLKKTWEEGTVDLHLVVLCVWAALGLGVLQTYILGNPLGRIEGRFTGFTSPQNFATFLVCCLALILFSQLPRATVIFNSILILAAILLSGSRYVFLGTVTVFLLLALTQFQARSRRVKFGSGAALLGIAALGLALWVVARYAPDSRMNELQESYSEGSVENIGTLVERLGIYETAINQIVDRFNGQWGTFVFGSGTSSAARIFDEFNAPAWQENQDANRAVHDEFLRALYEWGVIGAILFLSFVVATFLRYAKAAFRQRKAGALAVIAIFPTMLLGLAIENILAGAVTGGGTGYLLVLAYGASFAGHPSFGQAEVVRVPEKTICWTLV